MKRFTKAQQRSVRVLVEDVARRAAVEAVRQLAHAGLLAQTPTALSGVEVVLLTPGIEHSQRIH